VKENSSFDLRQDNVPVNLVAQVSVGSENRGYDFNRIRH
jgi:hypothetical protein